MSTTGAQAVGEPKDADAKRPKTVTAIVIGAGNRGKSYSQYAEECPDKFQVVGVAEPREYHREFMVKKYNIPKENVFNSWEEVAALPRLADAVLITTQDSMHVAPAVAFAAKGYHILLEKPMAVNPEDCKKIVAAVKAAGVHFAVGHVLRYTPYMQTIIRLIRSGVIGDVINIQHLEPVGFYHFAHSYVRGNWRREDEASFMLMAKACHDVDLLRYMVGRPCEKVSSFGNLKLFRKENKPEGASDRCVSCPDAIESKCAFSAKKIYLERAKAGHFGWPVSPILDVAPSVEAVEAALTSGPYGRCVWSCDNDVVDHQVVNMQFEGGATASLSVISMTEKLCQRQTKIFGTKGELEGDGNKVIQHFDFLTQKKEVIVADEAPAHSAMTGHGGADYFLIKSFVDAVAFDDSSYILSGPDETLESHLMVFAAEKSRHTSGVVAVTADGVKIEERDFSW